MANVVQAVQSITTIAAPSSAPTAPKDTRAEVLEIMRDVCARTRRLVERIEAKQAARDAAVKP